jgi:hypothetical protein
MMAQCPICKLEAEVIEPGQIEVITFSCPTHGEFGVAGNVFRVQEYMNANSTRWERALQIAKIQAPPGTRPKITHHEF